MKRTLSVLTLTLLGSQIASAGYIKIHNRGKLAIHSMTYNSGDHVTLAPQDGGITAVGGIQEFNCDSSDGCKVVITTPNNLFLVHTRFYANGYYHLDGRWHLESDGYSVVPDSPVTLTRAPANGTEVRRERASLPVPGGGAADCLSTAQPNTVLNNGVVELAWQGDGNLVLYRQGGVPIWASNTAGRANAVCFQGDGNLVIYNGGTPVWSSKTNGKGTSLKLLASCEVVIPDSSGRYAWASQTHCE